MIRLATSSDAPQIADIYRPFVLETPVSFENEAPNAEEMVNRINTVLLTHPWLVADREGQVMGFAYSSPHRTRFHYQWSVDVTVYVHPNYRRCGVGRALYHALLKVLSLQGFVMAHAGITLPNAGSIGLHESMGFMPIGTYRNVGHKLGKWHDVGWWGLELLDPASDPQNPKPLNDIVSSEAWNQALSEGSTFLNEI